MNSLLQFICLCISFTFFCLFTFNQVILFIKLFSSFYPRTPPIYPHINILQWPSLEFVIQCENMCVFLPKLNVENNLRAPFTKIQIQFNFKHTQKMTSTSPWSNEGNYGVYFTQKHLSHSLVLSTWSNKMKKLNVS